MSLQRSISLNEGGGKMPAFEIPPMPPNFEHLKMQTIRMNCCVMIGNDSSICTDSQPWVKTVGYCTGSGFIIHSRIIVTNAHVVEHAEILTIRKVSLSIFYSLSIVFSLSVL